MNRPDDDKDQVAPGAARETADRDATGAGKEAGREVRRVRFGRFDVPLPRDRIVRWIAGTLLIVLGILGFLPILGFWMIPLGLLFFTPDSPGLQRAVRRFEAWTRLVSQRAKQWFDRYKRSW